MVAKRAGVGTQSRRRFAIAAIAVSILGVVGLLQLLTRRGGWHDVGPALEVVGAVLAGTALVVEWVRNGPRT